MSDRELMQEALSVLQRSLGYTCGAQKKIDEIKNKLRERLSQPDPEPVAWLDPDFGEAICPEIGYEVTILCDHPKDLCWVPLYKAPPNKEWVGLTDEEVNEIYSGINDSVRHAVRRAEDKLKDKNG